MEEQLETLFMGNRLFGSAAGATFEIVTPKQKEPEFIEDALSGPAVHSLFEEAMEVPNLIDLGSESSMIAMIGTAEAKPLDPRTLIKHPAVPLKNWVTFTRPRASQTEMED